MYGLKPVPFKPHAGPRLVEDRPSGAKAQRSLCCGYGTTEVVP